MKRKKKPIDRMPGNAAGRRKLRRYLERYYAALDIETTFHDCMAVKLPKGFKYDGDLIECLLRKQSERFTDDVLRALVLDGPLVGPTWEELKPHNFVSNPFNPYPLHNFFIQAAAAEAMTQRVVDGRQRLRAYAEMDAVLTSKLLSRSELDQPIICACGQDMSAPPAADCPIPSAHGDDVYK